MFLWHQRPPRPSPKGKRGWNPGERLGVFVIRGLPGNLNTSTFLGSEAQWLVRLIWKHDTSCGHPNLKGNGCFFHSEAYDKMSKEDESALIISLSLAGRKKASSQNMAPHPEIRSLCLSWLTIKNMVKLDWLSYLSLSGIHVCRQFINDWTCGPLSCLKSIIQCANWPFKTNFING